jgi:hypothetical protein
MCDGRLAHVLHEVKCFRRVTGWRARSSRELRITHTYLLIGLSLTFDLLCTWAGLAGHFVRSALGGLLYLMPRALGRLLHPMAGFLGGGLHRSSGVLGGVFSFVGGGFRVLLCTLIGLSRECKRCRCDC